MLGLRRLLAASMILAAILALAACKPAKDEQTTDGGQSTSFSFRFNSRTAGSATTAATTSVPLGLVEITGHLLVVPDGEDPSAGKVYTLSLMVDEGTSTITTEVTLPLHLGAYDVYFLLDAFGSQYAGIVVNHLILSGGLNTISVTLNPVVGGPVASVFDLAGLSAYSVRYDPDALRSYTYPRLGLSVDGGPELLYDVLINDDEPIITLFLPSGTHTVSVRFFDGAVVKSVPVDNEPIEPAPAGEPPPEIPVVPLTAEATYSFTGSATDSTVGTGTFTFTVPKDVIAEALPSTGTDPLGNLQAVASIVGPENPLVEVPVTLSPVTDVSTGEVLHYTGAITIDGFVPGPITWQLSFQDIEDSQKFAYCAQSVDTTATATPDTGTFVCSLNLLVRAQVSNTTPMGAVQVNVSDVLGPVVGAVVLLDGEVLGVTGGTAGVDDGLLWAFVEPGDHTLEVTQEILDPFGSGEFLSRTSGPLTITVAGNTDGALLAALDVPVTLPPFPFGAPEVTGVSPADGSGNVPVDTTIAVTYSHKMDPVSAQNGFHINPDVPGTFSWNSGQTVMTFTPDVPLAYLTDYKLTIDASTQDVVGTQLKSGRTFDFSTGVEPDVVSPEVTGVTPGPGATNVDVGTIVTVNFSEAMDTSTVEGNLKLIPDTAGEYHWSGDSTTVTFKPSADLQYDTAYTIHMDGTATDMVGNPITAGLDSTFTTGVEPDTVQPWVRSIVPGTTNPPVPVDTTVVVTFSESMTPGDTQDAFSIRPETAGSYKWNGDNTELTFTPSSLLEHDREYSVLVTTKAKDAAGLSLAQEATAKFRTVLPPPSPTYIEVEAGRGLRPRKFDDGFYDITEPTTIRIPRLEDVSIVEDPVTHELLGDPDRYLLVLTLGHEKCMYLGGKWDRHVGGVAEDFFEDAFKAPVCRHHRPGELMTLYPRPDGYTPQHSDGHYGNGEYLNRYAEIKARVVTGNPHFNETRVKVRIEVVQP